MSLIKHSFWAFLIFALPVFSQNKADLEIFTALDRIETSGEEEFFVLLNPMLQPSSQEHEKLHGYYFLGLYYGAQEKIDSLTYYGNKILHEVISKTDSVSMELLSKAYHLLSIAHRKQGLYTLSKGYNLKGIELHDKGHAHNVYTKAYHMRGLADSYSVEEEYEKAIDLYHESIALRLSHEVTFGACMNLGVLYAEKEEFKKAIPYFEQALQICEDENIPRCVAFSLLNIGGCFLGVGDLDKGLVYLQKAKEVTMTLGKRQALSLLHINSNIAYIFMQQDRLNEAFDLFQVVLQEARELKFTATEITALINLKEVMLKQDNYKQALYYETQRLELIDSLHKAQKNKEISELEVRYRTTQKQKEIEVLKMSNSHKALELAHHRETIENLTLQQQNDSIHKANEILSLQNASQSKKNEIALLKKDQIIREADLRRQQSSKKIMIVAFLLILIPVIGLLILYKQKLRVRKQLHTKQEEINREKIANLLQEQELRLITASIEGQDRERRRIAQELHDSIGGSLAAIKLQFGQIKDSDERVFSINRQIDETYEQIRDLSHNLIPKKFTMNTFTSLVEDYMQNIGNSSHLSIKVDAFPGNEINRIDQNLQIELFKILQELMTNTIKHAKADRVDIQLNLVDDEINVIFEDDGIGFNAQKMHSGIGFKNIKSRLKSLNGSMHIDSYKDRGTIVSIEVKRDCLNINGVV